MLSLLIVIVITPTPVGGWVSGLCFWILEIAIASTKLVSLFIASFLLQSFSSRKSVAKVDIDPDHPCHCTIPPQKMVTPKKFPRLATSLTHAECADTIAFVTLPFALPPKLFPAFYANYWKSLQIKEYRLWKKCASKPGHVLPFPARRSSSGDQLPS